MAISLASIAAKAASYPSRAASFGRALCKLAESVKSYVDSGTATLTNKTLTSPVLTTPQINDTSADHQYIVAPSELAADRTVTLPLLAGNDEITFNAHSQVLENKKLEATCSIVDTADNTKDIVWDLSGATTDKTVTVVSSQTDDRSITLPDATDTLVGKSTSDVLANKTLTSPVVNDPVMGSAIHSEATGELSSAEILALNATPIELVAAPGAGKAVIVDEIELFLDYGSAAYVRDGGDEELVIEYGTSGTDIHAFANATDAFLTSSADARRLIKPTAYDTATANFDPDDADNEAVVATITNSEVITGDSPIKYRVSYRIVTLIS